MYDPGVWESGHRCLARFQNLYGQVTAKCPPFFPFQMVVSTTLIIFLSLYVVTYLSSATESREAASKKSLPDMIVYQEILDLEPNVVTR